jgi:hypothetical protein
VFGMLPAVDYLFAGHKSVAARRFRRNSRWNADGRHGVYGED